MKRTFWISFILRRSYTIWYFPYTRLILMAYIQFLYFLYFFLFYAFSFILIYLPIDAFVLYYVRKIGKSLFKPGSTINSRNSLDFIILSIKKKFHKVFPPLEMTRRFPPIIVRMVLFWKKKINCLKIENVYFREIPAFYSFFFTYFY